MRGQQLIDITGQRFGRLVVIKLDHRDQRFYVQGKGGGFYWWLCKCDCGKQRAYPGSTLKSGRATTCGCGKMLDSKPGESGLKELYQQYKHSAGRNKRAFDIKLHDFKKLTSSNCYYCGTEPKHIMGRNSDYSKYAYNGLDRVDSSKSYTLDNVVSCCGMCNVMKNSHKQIEFIEQVKRIYYNLNV